jgi:hypothetical protein
VTTAGAFVLGGIAAAVLATAIALGGYGRSSAAPVGSARPARPTNLGGSVGAPSDARGEYLLDVSEVTEASKLPP